MPLRLGALHDALLHPGDADLAKQAAEEVADYKQTIADLRRDLDKLQWTVTWTASVIIGLLLTLGGGNLWLTVNLLARLPR